MCMKILYHVLTTLIMSLFAFEGQRKCIDLLCSKPIAIVVTISSYTTNDANYLQFSSNEFIVVYSYGIDNLQEWDGKIQEGRQGLFFPNYTKIIKILHPEDKLNMTNTFDLFRNLNYYNISSVINMDNLEGVLETDTYDTNFEASSHNSFLESRNMGQESRRGPPPKDPLEKDETVEGLNAILEAKLNNSGIHSNAYKLSLKDDENTHNRIEGGPELPNQSSIENGYNHNSFSQKPNDVEQGLKADEEEVGISFLSPIVEERISYSSEDLVEIHDEKQEAGISHNNTIDYLAMLVNEDNLWQISNAIKSNETNDSLIETGHEIQNTFKAPLISPYIQSQAEDVAQNIPQDTINPSNNDDTYNVSTTHVNEDNLTYVPHKIPVNDTNDLIDTNETDAQDMIEVPQMLGDDQSSNLSQGTTNFDNGNINVAGKLTSLDPDNTSKNLEDMSAINVEDNEEHLHHNHGDTYANYNTSNNLVESNETNLSHIDLIPESVSNQVSFEIDTPEAPKEDLSDRGKNMDQTTDFEAEKAPQSDKNGTLGLGNQDGSADVRDFQNQMDADDESIKDLSSAQPTHLSNDQIISDLVKDPEHLVQNPDPISDDYYPTDGPVESGTTSTSDQGKFDDKDPGLKSLSHLIQNPDSISNDFYPTDGPVESGTTSTSDQGNFDESSPNEGGVNNSLRSSSDETEEKDVTSRPIEDDNTDYHHPSLMTTDDGRTVRKYNVCESIKVENGDIIHDPNCKKYMSDSLLLNDDTLSDSEISKEDIEDQVPYTSFIVGGIQGMLAFYQKLLVTLVKGVVGSSVAASPGGVSNDHIMCHGPKCVPDDTSLTQKIFRMRTFLILLFTFCGTLSFFMGLRKNNNENNAMNSEAVTQAYEVNKRLDDITILFNAYEQKILELEATLTSKEDEINDLTANNSEYKDLECRLEQLEMEKESLSTISSKVPTLERDNESLEALAVEYREKLMIMEAEIKELKIANEKLSENYRITNQSYEESKALSSQTQNEFDKAKGEYEEMCQKVNALQNEILEKTHLIDSYETLLKKLNVLKNFGFQNVQKRNKTLSSVSDTVKGDLEGEWGIDEGDNASEILVESEESVTLDEATIRDLLDSTALFKEIENLKSENVDLKNRIAKHEKDQADLKGQTNKKDVEVSHFKNRCATLENSTKELEGKLAFISKYFEDKECKLQRNINDLMNECEKYKKQNEDLEKRLELLRKQADVYLENLDESKKDFYECQKDMRHRINELEDASNKLKITAHGFERKANHLQCENQNLRQTLNELEKNLEASTNITNRNTAANLENAQKESSPGVAHSDDNHSSSSHASKQQDKRVGKKLKSKLGADQQHGIMPPFPFFPPLLPPMGPAGGPGKHENTDPRTVGPNPNPMMPQLMMPPFFMGPPSKHFGKGDREGNMTDGGLAILKGANTINSTSSGHVKKKKGKSNTVEIKNPLAPSIGLKNGHESDFSASSVSAVSSLSAARQNFNFNSNNAPPFLIPPFPNFMMPHSTKFGHNDGEGDASFSDFSQLASHSSPLQPDASVQEVAQSKKKKTIKNPTTNDRLV